MKFAIIDFPGSSSKKEIYEVVTEQLAEEAVYVAHDAAHFEAFDAIILPGGFSYGDYLRPGAIASMSNVMKEVKKAAEKGISILGIGNGFQILLEAGLLPGTMRKNESLRFICRMEHLQVNNANTLFTSLYQEEESLHIPIAHGNGNYYCDDRTLQAIKNNGQIVFTYADENPNGSVESIAGLMNGEGNVLGLMPHPERAVQSLLGSADGLKIFQSIVKSWREANVDHE